MNLAAWQLSLSVAIIEWGSQRGRTKFFSLQPSLSTRHVAGIGRCLPVSSEHAKWSFCKHVALVTWIIVSRNVSHDEAAGHRCNASDTLASTPSKSELNFQVCIFNTRLRCGDREWLTLLWYARVWEVILFIEQCLCVGFNRSYAARFMQCR